MQNEKKACEHKFNDNRTCTLCGLVDPDPLLNYEPDHAKPGDDQHVNAERSTGTALRYYDKGLGSRDPKAFSQRLVFAMIELDKLCELMSLPRSVQEEIAYLYRKTPHHPGVNTHLVLGALAFIVCRQRCISRTHREVFDTVTQLGLDRRNSHGYSYFNELTRRLAREMRLRVRIATPIEYLDRFATKLGLASEERARACHVLSELEGKNPNPVISAGVALYAASGLSLRQVSLKLGIGIAPLWRAAKKLAVSCL